MSARKRHHPVTSISSSNLFRLTLFALVVAVCTIPAPVGVAGCCEHTIEMEVALDDCSGMIGFDAEDGSFCGGVFESSCCNHSYGFPC
jgi:hypothetical protein